MLWAQNARRGQLIVDDSTQDRLSIIEAVQNWALWRDAGDWERLPTVWHDDGWMTATWFQGPAESQSNSRAAATLRDSAIRML